MQTRTLIAILCLGVGLSGTALAEDSPWYVGIQAGQFSVDLSEFDSTNGVGVMLGYKVNNLVSIEGALTTTGEDGDVTVQGVQGVGNWDLTTTAVYAAIRSSGNLYFKGKVGYLYEKVTASISGLFYTSDSQSDFSYGVGAGWRIGDGLGLELEYTIIEEDIDFISLGVNFGF